ncbi:MAG TPA: citrate/2-methylcitrate synthase [Vicinamibacteria bacterium]
MTEAVAKPAGTGLRNVAVSESRISSIDGERGILAYRGIDIHELAASSSFEETSFLLHEGRLPRRGELADFTALLVKERTVADGVLAVARQIPRHTHPMTTLRTVVSALGADGKDADDDSPEAVARKSQRLIAQMATLVAALDRIRRGLHPLGPDSRLSHAANFLYMLRGERPSEAAARNFDVALVLHADHEFNASTFAARVAASTLADVHGAVTAAVATLKGPLHGGANEAVMKTLEAIGAPERVDAWVETALAQKQKIMGFGHAVYKTEDPRATHLRKMSKALGEETGETKWYAMSERMEALVKAKKGLNPNVDFYSASAYRSLGIPTDLFTPVFAVSRIAGWTAHVREQLANNKLIRPEADYQGPRNVRYVPLAERG